ncbi:MAG: patatin-like phospholipase family protein [Minisyncoccia bacterium]
MKKVGLALGSGGVKGLAHIGVIKTLVKHNIKIDYIAGSSIGALIGGLYSATLDISQVEKWFLELTYKDLLRILFEPYFYSGLIKGEKVVSLIKSKVGNIKIEGLKIPFKAVATDLIIGESVIFDKGDLSLAIRASGAVPFLISPVYLKDKCLVDGGVSMPIPVKVVKKMGADIVIAVNLDFVYFNLNNNKTLKQKLNIKKVVEKSLNVLRYQLAKENIKEADIVINPIIKKGSIINFIHGKDIIREGEKVTEEVIPKILELIN